MKNWQAWMAAAALVSSPLMVAATPRAVIADPVRNEKHPAHNQQLLIPSGAASMNAVLLQAAGSGPKPTLLLLHGLPGNEQNLDLAQAIRRAGWNVLTLHYRGSWGSAGTFSIANAVEDAEAAMAFLKHPDNATRYGVDTGRLAIGGHSMGGFAAARYAAAHQDLAGVVLLDPWNVGADAKSLQGDAAARKAMLADLASDLGTSLGAVDAAALMAEIERHGDDWDLMALAPALAARPALIIGAEFGGGEPSKALAAAIRAQGKGRSVGVTLHSDHAFADQRITLAGIVVDWLQRAAPATLKTRAAR